MRGAKAKELRGQAEGETTGLPKVRYVSMLRKEAIRKVTMLVLSGGTRSRYKELKKAYYHEKNQ